MPRIGVGSTLAYDGDLCQIIEIQAGAVVLVDSRGSARRVRLIDLLTPAEEGGLAQLPRDEDDPKARADAHLDGVLWKTASPAAREKARQVAGDVREVKTGFRSGTAAIAEEGEPRPEYDARSTKMQEREQAKAIERGVSVRLVEDWCLRYQKFGEPGLLDRRSVRSGTLLQNLDPDWLDTCTQVLAELQDLPRVRKSIVLDWIEARVRQRTIKGDFADRVVRRPGKSTGHKVLDELSRGRALFKGSTKGKRSIAGRPEPPYGRIVATRPGEYLLLDTTRLNVFGLDAMTGEWDSVEMTSALDLADRTIKGVRLSPRSSKSIDVASVLLEAMQPFARPSSWRTDSSWPYSGIPDHILVNTEKIKVDRFWTAEDELKRKRQIDAQREQSRQRREQRDSVDGVLPEAM